MISPAQLARQQRIAKRLLLALVIFICTMAVVTIVFGPELTWRAVIFAGALTFFVGSSQLAFERSRRRRDDLDHFRKRVRRVAGEDLPKDVAVKVDGDGRVSRARETPPV